MQDVAYAFVETNGNISVLLKTNVSPATKKDIKKIDEQSCLNIILVNHGKIINENMQSLGLKQDFIDNILQKQQTKNLKDVLILTINSNGEVYYQEKNKQSQVLNVEVNI